MEAVSSHIVLITDACRERDMVVPIGACVNEPVSCVCLSAKSQTVLIYCPDCLWKYKSGNPFGNLWYSARL